MDLYQGTGTFLQVLKPLILSSDITLCFGQSKLTFEELEDNKLSNFVFDGSIKGYIFVCDPTMSMLVTIGRSESANIRMIEQGVSRV